MQKKGIRITICLLSVVIFFCVLTNIYLYKKIQKLTINENVEKNELITFKDNLANENMKTIDTDIETIALNDFKENYNWLGEKKYEKVTLTNQDGFCLDITNNEIWNNYFLKEYTFESNVFKYTTGPKASDTYVYTFYFQNGVKEIRLGYMGHFKDSPCWNNELLYNIAESIMPIHDYFKEVIYNPKAFMLNAKIWTVKMSHKDPFIHNSNNKLVQNVILNWLPQNTIQIDKLPDVTLTENIKLTCYLYGQQAILKSYNSYINSDCYIELLYNGQQEFYEFKGKYSEDNLYFILSNYHD